MENQFFKKIAEILESENFFCLKHTGGVANLNISRKSDENEYWRLQNLENSLQEINDIKNANNLNIRGNVQISIEVDIYEKMWIKMVDKKEREMFFNFFNDFMWGYNHFEINNLKKLKNNDFINEMLENFLNKKNDFRYYDFESVIKLIDSKLFKINKDVFYLFCKKGSSELLNIVNQEKIREIVENEFKNNIDEFRQFWKKIDHKLINENEIISEGVYRFIGLNKIFIFNTRKENQIDFYERRLKWLTSFLNKKAIKEKLNIERCIFDGMQESQKEYRFLFIENNNSVITKDLIKELALNIIKDEADPDIKKTTKILNYFLLKNKMPELNNDANVNRVKI